MAQDAWLRDYNACISMAQDIRVQINERNKHPKGSTAFTRESAHIRTEMRKYSSMFGNLRTELIQASTRGRIMPGEVERRQMLLDELSTKERQLEQALKPDDPLSGRSALFEQGGFGAGPSSSQSTNPFDNPADDFTFNEIRQQQRQVIREQDEGLEALSHVISRQKALAVDIGNELDTQNDLIDDIGDHVDSTDQRLLTETRHIKIVDRKSNTCCMWVVIIFLFIAILVIAVVPFNGKP